MKFAIASDIHGNLFALNAVMDDAKKNRVDSYIFIGDYCLNSPYPNECISKIREINHKYVVRGNEEKYLENLIDKDQSTWTDGQMQISYWCYRNICSDNLQYILDCPNDISFRRNGIEVHISHSSERFIDDNEHKEWSTYKVAKRYPSEAIGKDIFTNDIFTYLNHNSLFQDKLNSLSKGIYIFGHSHIQWSYKSKDGKTVLINPGSCGLPLDCIRNTIPYTILDITERGEISVEERRIPYDVEAYLEKFVLSSQYTQANVWSKIIIKELKTAREHLCFFLQYVEEYAKKIRDTQRPFSVLTWENAYSLWEQEIK